MTQKRREAALEENKQKGAADVHPKARVNGEKGDFKKCKDFSSAPVPMPSRLNLFKIAKAVSNYASATSPCNLLLSTVSS